MKTKLLSGLQALSLILVLVVVPAYGDLHDSENFSPERPPKPPIGSADAYNKLKENTSLKSAKFSNDVGEDPITLDSEKLSKIGVWAAQIETMHSKIVDSCKTDRGAAQLDELLHSWVSKVSAGLTPATGGLLHVWTRIEPSKKVNVSGLYMLTKAIREVLAKQVPDGEKADSVKAQNEKLLDMLDKTNRMIAGVDSQEALDKKFGSQDLKGVAIQVEKGGQVSADNRKRNLQTVVDEAKASIDDSEKICEFGPKSTTNTADSLSKLAERLAAMEKQSAADKQAAAAELEAAKVAHQKDLDVARKQAQAQAQRFNPSPAGGNPGGDKPGAAGVAETGGAGGAATGGPSDPQFASIGPGVNGIAGDLAALKEDADDRVKDLERDQAIQNAQLAAQVAAAQNQTPNFRSSSVAPPAQPAAPALPAIPPINLGGGGFNNQGPYPPVNPYAMGPNGMNGMYPGGQPYASPQPVAPLPPMKVTETTTEQVTPVPPAGSMIAPIPMPTAPPALPYGTGSYGAGTGLVNSTNVYLTVRLADGTITSLPASSIPAGATVISQSNPYGGAALTTTSGTGTTTVANVNSIAGQISQLNTSSRTSSTSSTANTSSVSSTTGGARASLTQ